MAWQPQSGPAMGTEEWKKREEAIVEQWRKDEAARIEKETHEQECRAYEGFCYRKADALRERNHRTDEEAAAVWERAGQEIQQDRWLVDRVVTSDPAIGRFQSLRTRLLYQGKTAQI